MKKTISIIILLALLWVVIDLIRTVWLGKGEEPTDTYRALAAPAPKTIENPQTNGYLLMLGFASAENADPLRVGREMWLEAESDRGHRLFDYAKESRLALRVPDETFEAVQAKGTGGALDQLRALSEPAKNLMASHALLLDRYRQWLHLPFEDWGDGHPGTPRVADLYAVHRLYLAEGWGQGLGPGIERLAADLVAWRGVLANARTLPLKVFAAAVLDEDMMLMSEVLRLPEVDSELARRLEPLVRPLAVTERSLRWPIQSEFVEGVSLFELPLTGVSAQLLPESEAQKRWIAAFAGLAPNAFQMVEQPIPANMLSRAPMQKQRTLNIYADYCAATMKASDVPNSPFPKLLDMARLNHRRFLDYFINPIDNVFASGPEPLWAPFADRLLRSDVRMRLLGLQAKLRPGQSVPSRVVQAGYDYYDPFSGLPMLWASATGQLYSVGEDRKDDGGDEVRDISLRIWPLSGGASPAIQFPSKAPEPARRR